MLGMVCKNKKWYWYCNNYTVCGNNSDEGTRESQRTNQSWDWSYLNETIFQFQTMGHYQTPHR